MSKTIFITGSTDGIGLEAAKTLVSKGHRILLHARNQDKLKKAMKTLSADGFIADLSDLEEVKALADKIRKKYKALDVIINNAGILKASKTVTDDGFDIRFMVNTIAPYLLTQQLMPLLEKSGRIINLSSAAQSPVNLDALSGKLNRLDDMEAYSQSITMWSMQMAKDIGSDGPVIIPVNPASLIGSKMVKEGFGIEGKDLSVGADILCRLAIDDEFSDKSGQYYDNDLGRFSSPHLDAMDTVKRQSVLSIMHKILQEKEPHR